MEGAFTLAADGTAKDPKAFQQAIRQDADKMAELEKVTYEFDCLCVSAVVLSKLTVVLLILVCC
jgi:hypothetical protein